jgi:hypothetical protein
MMKKLLFLLSVTLTFAAASLSAQTNYNGNGNGGFGEPVGGSNMSINDNGTTVTVTFNKGIGDFNDDMVIYIDSKTGGFSSTANFADPDSGDRLRRAITGAGIFEGGTRSIVNFPAGFEADYAIAVNTGFGGLWELVENGSFPFINGVGNPTNATDASFVMSFNKEDIGINQEDNVAFNFVITYMNAFGGDGVFRSDEGYGAGLPTGNPGTDDVTFTSFEVYDASLNVGTKQIDKFTARFVNNELIISGINASAKLELYNLLGQNVFNRNNVTINNQLTIGNLNLVKGVYLLKISIVNSSKTIKLVNQ